MYETAIKKFKNPIPSSYNDRKVVFYVLHTGIQWKELKTNRNELHWSNIYKWYNRWSKDGWYKTSNYETFFLSFP